MAWRVRWTDPAWEHLDGTAAFIARDSPRYARVLVLEAREATRSLQTFPHRGHLVREWRDPNVREIHIQKHRLIYQILEAEREVRILALIHSARDLAAMRDGGEV